MPISDTPEGRRDLARLFDMIDKWVMAPARKRRGHYESFLSDKRKLRDYLLITYRRRDCRCVLLHVLSTRDGVMLGKPPRQALPGAGGRDVKHIGREVEPANMVWLDESAACRDHIVDWLRCNHGVVRVKSYGDIRGDIAATRSANHRGVTITL